MYECLCHELKWTSSKWIELICIVQHNHMKCITYKVWYREKDTKYLTINKCSGRLITKEINLLQAIVLPNIDFVSVCAIHESQQCAENGASKFSLFYFMLLEHGINKMKKLSLITFTDFCNCTLRKAQKSVVFKNNFSIKKIFQTRL